MDELKVGLKVNSIKNAEDNHQTQGVAGTVIGIGARLALVEFDENVNGHDGHTNKGFDMDGYDQSYKEFPYGKNGRCWYFAIDDFFKYFEIVNGYVAELL